MEYVKRELQRGLGDWEQRLNTALVPAGPGDLVSEKIKPEPAVVNR